MKFSEEQLRNKDFFTEVKEEANKLVSELNSREAYDFSRDLKQSLEEIKDFKIKYYDLYREYWRLIIKLRWLGLPIMVELEKEVVDMFKNHFARVFSIPDFDVWKKLKEVLLGIIVLDNRDKLKKEIRQVLLSNQEKITGKRILIDGQEKEPTVANWLLDYNKTLGTGKVNNIARTQYLTNGRNIKNLSSEEKKKIRTLFDLYERLKLSSQTLEGLEDDIPLDEDYAKGTIKQGVFEPFKEPTGKEEMLWELAEKTTKERMEEIRREMKGETGEVKDTDELEKMLSQYPAGSLERRAVEEEIRKLKVKS
ncbi:MAG: hypothetical protein PHZ04_00230 [Patescibacteria group bacterium]|nr:hypothetical protein [Patescibacteria group bacterium]MDD5295255.1 hypothetical protein [Patescibacteria group bacterium]MDD5554504.1 hypothetical protein [Patescibacteria group bacterium]